MGFNGPRDKLAYEDPISYVRVKYKNLRFISLLIISLNGPLDWPESKKHEYPCSYLHVKKTIGSQVGPCL